MFRKPGSWAAGFHTGADYGAPQNTPVYAYQAGTVVETGMTSWGAAYGDRCVIVQHADGTRMLYAHLEACAVSRGQKVEAGQLIGKVGNRGRSFGPHLHAELRKSPYRYAHDCLDPAKLHSVAAKPESPKYPGRNKLLAAQKKRGKVDGLKEFKAALKKRRIPLGNAAMNDVYGDALTEAVKKAQAKVGLPVSGVPGIHIWQWAFTGKLSAAAKKKIAETKRGGSGKGPAANAAKSPAKRPVKRAAAKKPVVAQHKGKVSAAHAVAWLQRKVDSKAGGYKGLCAKLVTQAFGYAGGYPSADAWAKAAKAKGVTFHKSIAAAPPGAVHFWYGNAGYRWGHIAVAAGGGKMFTNWSDGTVIVTAVTNSRWSNLPYAGWVDDSRIFAGCVGSR